MPTPVGIDPDGRERLTFIEGDVPTSPYPAWSQTDMALASIARLLRRLHDASAGFDPQDFEWSDALADPAGGSIVCHNDVELSNVVFRDGVAVAIIDFEFAAPGRPEYDVAHLARLCVPIEDDYDQARLNWQPAHRPARLRLVAMPTAWTQPAVPACCRPSSMRATRSQPQRRECSRRVTPDLIVMLNRTGGMAKYERLRRWRTRHRDEFAATPV